MTNKNERLKRVIIISFKKVQSNQDVTFLSDIHNNIQMSNIHTVVLTNQLIKIQNNKKIKP